jgi:protoheme IX farnesyltransferase
MATKPILAAADLHSLPHAHGRLGRFSDYWALTKPEINFLIMVTTAAGFWTGCAEPLSHSGILLFHTLVGTLLVASGAAVLNQLIEMRFDAQMRRTAGRPVAAGRIEPAQALAFGVRLSVVGVAYLVFTTTALAAVLAALTLLSYLFLYTPAKRMTPWCTLIGAVPGAMPPLIGCAAAMGHLTATAWVLFAIVLLWQFPHFMAIAWMYRDDYARAGYQILPSDQSRDRFVTQQTMLPALALPALGLMPSVVTEAGAVVSGAALVLGLFYLYHSARFSFWRSSVTARHLLAASIFYLPALFGLFWYSICALHRFAP